MKTPNYADVWEVFAPLIGAPSCIAGGAVRDGLIGRKPNDYDIFCFRRFNRRALLSAGVTVLDEQLNVTYAGSGRSDCLTVRWRGLKVQFVHQEGPTDVDELLTTFDWNICLFAYDGQLTKWMDPREMGRGHVLRLNPTGAIRSAVKTLCRGYRFAERYGMKIDASDLATLTGTNAAQDLAMV